MAIIEKGLAEFVNECVTEWPNVLDRAKRKHQRDVLRIADHLERTKRLATRMKEASTVEGVFG